MSDIDGSVAAAGSQATTTTVLGVSERRGRPGAREDAKKKKEAKHKLNKKQKMVCITCGFLIGIIFIARLAIIKCAIEY